MSEKDEKVIASVDLKTMKYTEEKPSDFLSSGKRLFVISVLIEILLGLGHVWVTWFPELGHHKKMIRFFHFDREGNLPSWFSSTQFLVLAAIFGGLYFLQRYQHTGKLWIVCAAAAVFLSLDEAAAFHELLGTYLGVVSRGASEGTWIHSLQYFPSYYWMMIYVPLALPLSAVILRILYKELQGEFRMVLAGGIIFVLGAVALDFLEGYYGTPDHKGIYIRGESGIAWVDTALIEEFMEMFGVSLVIYAFIRHYEKMRAVSNSAT
ncbi:MAG: hypothetical protein DHS20C02_19610 [Micavibrio sp.]|nr:MAG: hypothetical protein DHS20C02_19610 [Micavibrio sp.]